jgi:acylphosphatase
MKAYTLNITGDVQGVSYRYFARTKAENLGLSGWALNEHDGSVTIFVQGEEGAVQKMIEWAHEGSPMATVNDVAIKDAELDEQAKGFIIK